MSSRQKQTALLCSYFNHYSSDTLLLGKGDSMGKNLFPNLLRLEASSSGKATQCGIADYTPSSLGIVAI